MDSTRPHTFAMGRSCPLVKSAAVKGGTKKSPWLEERTHVNTDRGEGGGHILLSGRGVSAEHKEHVGSQVTHLWCTGTDTERAGRVTGGAGAEKMANGWRERVATLPKSEQKNKTARPS